jgi:hypothetical protein
MSINLSTVRDVTIAKVHTLAVDPSKFNADVLEYIFTYGLKQVLNDAGSAGKSPDQKRNMAIVKLDALYKGELRKAREAGAGKTGLAKAIEQVAAEMVKNSVGHISGKGEWKATSAQMAKAREYAAKYDLDLSDAESFMEAMWDIAAAHPVTIAEGTAKYEAEMARKAKLEAAASDVF